ncbi:MAG: MinD/ParA family protein [Candidatus Schekmanbacteria bacterium]|nr:MinD/ParA family protein [Candidatus Schekmanbacteria bacterium]
MTDQAGRLRELTGRGGGPSPRVLAISSGKGGVGKTNVVVNLSLAFAGMNQRVVVMDADFGLANVDILLGLAPKYTLRHVLFGSDEERMRLEDIIIEGPAGIRIIPASSGMQELTNLNDEQRSRLFGALSRLATQTDILVLDTAAGISDNVVQLLLAANEIILVTCPEPTAIVDAYALVKVVSGYEFDKKIQVVVNMANSDAEGQAVFEQLDAVVDKFLGRRLDYLGAVARDDHVLRAVRQQQPLLGLYPNSASARGFVALARQLLHEPPQQSKAGGFRRFVRQLVGRR